MAGRPTMTPPDYAPEVHLIMYLMEREGKAAAQAARELGKSRDWVYRRVKASRNGSSPKWIAEEWDRIRHGNPRCDLCLDPIPIGTKEHINEDGGRLEFCKPGCRQQWIEMEAG